jgi:hypothetical protein
MQAGAKVRLDNFWVHKCCLQTLENHNVQIMSLTKVWPTQSHCTGQSAPFHLDPVGGHLVDMHVGVVSRATGVVLCDKKIKQKGSQRDWLIVAVSLHLLTAVRITR